MKPNKMYFIGNAFSIWSNQQGHCMEQINSFNSDIFSLRRETKNENVGVAFPESVSMHLNRILTLKSQT